jgi:hypothetical protein
MIRRRRRVGFEWFYDPFGGDRASAPAGQGEQIGLFAASGNLRDGNNLHAQPARHLRADERPDGVVDEQLRSYALATLSKTIASALARGSHVRLRGGARAIRARASRSILDDDKK